MKRKAAALCKVLPENLQTPIPLKNITKLEFHHKKGQNGSPSTRAFIKTWIPALRYYNEEFVFQHVFLEAKGPKLMLFDKNQQKVEEIFPVFMTPEAIIEKIKAADSKIGLTPAETTPQEKKE